MTSKEYEKSLNNAFSRFRKENSSELINGSKFFEQIGSTLLEDIPYKNQLAVKESVLKDLLKENTPKEVIENAKIIASPLQTHYRFKAEFVTSFNPKFEPFNRFGQRKKGNFNWVVDLDEYILIEPEVFKKVRQVYDFAISLELNGYDLRQNTGDLRYLTIKSYKNASMLIITSANNDQRFEKVIDFAKNLGFDSVYWLLNNTKHDSFEGDIIKFVGQEYINIPIKVNSAEFKFSVGPFTFFQNNIYCFEVLLEYLDKFITDNNFKDYALYDLYSGVGLFGIIFARYFDFVKSIDIVQESIVMGNKIKEINNIMNIDFEARDIKDMHFTPVNKSIVIVDPPRNGLEQKGIENILEIKPEYLIYVSCNAVTFNNDLVELNKLYSVIDLAFFDTFPQTYHVECLCIMKRN